MDVKKKLDKRQQELHELQNICEDFESQLGDMHNNLKQDIDKIEDKKADGAGEMMVDEQGKKINILEEVLQVQEDLQDILLNVNEL